MNSLYSFYFDCSVINSLPDHKCAYTVYERTCCSVRSKVGPLTGSIEKRRGRRLQRYPCPCCKQAINLIFQDCTPISNGCSTPFLILNRAHCISKSFQNAFSQHTRTQLTRAVAQKVIRSICFNHKPQFRQIHVHTHAFNHKLRENNAPSVVKCELFSLQKRRVVQA